MFSAMNEEQVRLLKESNERLQQEVRDLQERNERQWMRIESSRTRERQLERQFKELSEQCSAHTTLNSELQAKNKALWEYSSRLLSDNQSMVNCRSRQHELIADYEHTINKQQSEINAASEAYKKLEETLNKFKRENYELRTSNFSKSKHIEVLTAVNINYGIQVHGYERELKRLSSKSYDLEVKNVCTKGFVEGLRTEVNKLLTTKIVLMKQIEDVKKDNCLLRTEITALNARDSATTQQINEVQKAKIALQDEAKQLKKDRDVVRKNLQEFRDSCYSQATTIATMIDDHRKVTGRLKELEKELKSALCNNEELRQEIVSLRRSDGDRQPVVRILDNGKTFAVEVLLSVEEFHSLTWYLGEVSEAAIESSFNDCVSGKCTGNYPPTLNYRLITANLEDVYGQLVDVSEKIKEGKRLFDLF